MESSVEIKSYQTIKPEYQEIITQLEKTIEILNQSILEKYNGLEYRGLWLYKPHEWWGRLRDEQLLVTEGVRKLYVEVLNRATEHYIVLNGENL